MQLTLALLGAFDIRLDGQPAASARAARVKALLVYLVCERDRVHTRSALDGLLFPDLPDKNARINLRQTITRLRRLLQEDKRTNTPFLLQTSETIQINPAAALAVDVVQFQARLQGCRRHQGQREAHCGDCAGQLEAGLALYGGAFLDGFFVADSEPFERWLQAKRERLQAEAAAACQFLADYYEGRGAYQRADVFVQKQLLWEPWRETAHRQRMRLLARQGLRGEALQQYQRCVERLAEELAVEPEAETVALWQRIRQMGGDKRPFFLPPLPNSSFVGRTTELAQIQQRLVAPEVRLLTLVGLGGMGKTRLALQVGWQLVDDFLGPFMEGVYFVTIDVAAAPSLSAHGLVMALGAALSLSFAAGTPPLEQLVAALQARPECLIILDNGEGLGTADCEVITAVLQQTTAVKFLVTSRVRLNLAQEWVLDLGGLSYPPVHPQLVRQLAEPDAYQAVQLFCQRAGQANGRFVWSQLSEEEKTAVCTLTQLTQGLPLALEMAAAWTHILSCQQIVAELQQALDILSTSRPDIPPRQQSIRAVFDYAWQLLDSKDQHFLADLTVFHGRFDYQAATEITGIALVSLSNLVNKALLQITADSSTPTYSLHPLLKQFIAEKADLAAQDITKKNHANYYGKFLAEHALHLQQVDTSTRLNQIQTAIENIHAGWQWATNHHDITLLEQYMHTLHAFYAFRGWWHEGQERFAAAVKQLQTNYANPTQIPLAEIPVYAHLLAYLAGYYYELSQIDEAERLSLESAKLTQLAEEPENIVMAYKRLAQISQWRGHYAQAERQLAFSQQLAQESDNKRQLCSIYMMYGALCRDQGLDREAKRYFEQSVALCRHLQDDWHLAHSLRLLAIVLHHLGEQQLAHDYCRQSFQLWQTLQDAVGEGLVLNNWGQLMFNEQRYEEAKSLYGQGLTSFQKINYQRGEALSLQSLGNLSSVQNLCQEARQHFYQSFQLALIMKDLPFLLGLLCDIAKSQLRDCSGDAFQSEIASLLHTVQQHPSSSRLQRQEAEQLLLERFAQNPLFSPTQPETVQAIERVVATVLVID